jgi:epoxyqueuosine reductase QueG
MILHALSKYGYWGISEELTSEFLFGKFDKNKIFESSNLGEIAPNGFPVTIKNGPRLFISYMITDAPLKVQIDRPIDVCNEECLELARKTSLNHIKYYKETFGIKKTVIDMLKSITKNNKFGEYIDFCYNCKLGSEFEINLLVKDPLDYKK